MKLRESQKHVLEESTGVWTWRKCYEINDKEVTEDEYNAAWDAIAARRARLGNTNNIFGTDVGTLCRPACWPMESTSLAIQPHQVAEGNAYLAASGCKSHYKENGKLEIPSASEQKKVLKLKGMTNFDSFS